MIYGSTMQFREFACTHLKKYIVGFLFCKLLNIKVILLKFTDGLPVPDAYLVFRGYILSRISAS